MSEFLTSSDARLAILEMTVAAMVAQLPSNSLEEVVSMLAYIADLAEDAKDVANPAGEERLGYVRHWANEMLSRTMASRKASRPDVIGPEEAERRRYRADRPLL